MFAGVQVPKATEAKNLAHQAADEVFGDLVVVREAHRRIALGLGDDMRELVAESVNKFLLLQDSACATSYLSLYCFAAAFGGLTRFAKNSAKSEMF